MLQALIFALAITLAVLLTIRDERKFKEKWPPIDDDEFMRRCPQETNRETALKVRRIVSKQLGIDYNRVYPEQSFVEDLGCE